MIIMSVDLGAARTGFAVSDSGEQFAFPRGIVKEYNREKLYDKIIEKAKENNAEIIVLGLPKNMDGSLGFKAQESLDAKEALERLCNIPFELWDERCTTVSAHNSLQVNGIRAKNRKDIVDSVAATIILEDYLRFRNSNK